ncbi:hypothetical protein [Paenibacillus protaetiae]|uniref:Uncharacterized protein n=1 Tax=Paenibacillus protaetiae TaxID=2509456 RepID=A0A4P6F9X9_9BACL|nr:hypothetical protein [Paenibacillus protaetiae]QAY67298.1 hypothetical protein ET464_13705 [Paenibacillus protaetiae]
MSAVKVSEGLTQAGEYCERKFIPIVTEHLLLFRTDYRPGGDLWILAPAQYKKMDADAFVTWKTAVKNVMVRLQEITPATVFESIKKNFPTKLQKTNTLEATIRRTLQELEAEGFISRKMRGQYVVA